MKNQLRIKIMQETYNIKQLKSVLKDMDDKRAFLLIEKQKELDKKIEFYKNIQKVLIK